MLWGNQGRRFEPVADRRLLSLEFFYFVIPAYAGIQGRLNLRVADPGLVSLPVIPAYAGIQGRRWQTGSWLLSFARPKESSQRKGRRWFTATDVVSLCCSTSSAPVELAVEFD